MGYKGLTGGTRGNRALQAVRRGYKGKARICKT